MRVYLTEGDGPPAEVHPPPSPRKYWTRKGVAHWLVERLAEIRRHSSASTTAFLSRCDISRFTGWSPTGQRFSTTSCTIGRPTRTTPTPISFARDRQATARRGPATGPLVARLCSRGPHRRSARRLLHCRLAVARQQGRQPRRVSRSEPDTARAQCGKRGRVDSRSGVATARFVILVKGLGRRPPLGCPGERPSWNRNVPPQRATGRRQDGHNALSSTDWCDREADRRPPG